MSNKRRIEDILAQDKLWVSTTVGYSMYPMLRDRKDTIIVRPYEGRLQKYDIPLYKKGSKYILHRIIDVLPDSYIIRGDNCVYKEYGITDQDILGVLTGFYRDSKEINMNGWKYKLYVYLWCNLYPLRIVMGYFRAVLAKLNGVLRKKGNSND